MMFGTALGNGSDSMMDRDRYDKASGSYQAIDIRSITVFTFNSAELVVLCGMT